MYSNFYFFTQFVDNFSNKAAFKAVYFKELAAYRKVRPLFELKKREGHNFSPDLNFRMEVQAAVQYRTAKAKGVLLVSQDW